MITLKGPSLFVAQFMGSNAPFDTLDNLAEWAAGLGYKALQLPCDPRLFDLHQLAHSQAYADDIRGRLDRYGVEVSELSTHLQGQLIAVHPAYDSLFDAFAPRAVHGNSGARRQWATEQVALAASASARLGLTAHATFSGSLAWPYLYPWPLRPDGLIELAFKELGDRWRPLLDTYDRHGVDVCFELHPGEDLHDGISFERFLTVVEQHPRAKLLYDPSHLHLQQIDYLAFIDHYHNRIGAFHVKDAEFRPDGRQGVYGGYSDWVSRAGRFRSLGDGQIDFKSIFSRLAAYDYSGWATLEWECCLKNSDDGAREGARFIDEHIIRVAQSSFDDFARSSVDSTALSQLLGLGGAQ